MPQMMSDKVYMPDDLKNTALATYMNFSTRDTDNKITLFTSLKVSNAKRCLPPRAMLVRLSDDG